MYTKNHAGRKGDRNPPSLYLTAPKAELVKTTTGWRDGNEHCSLHERSRYGETSGNPCGVGRAWQAWREALENLGDLRGPSSRTGRRHGMRILRHGRGNPDTGLCRSLNRSKDVNPVDLTRHGMRRMRHGRGNPDTGLCRSLQREGSIPNPEPNTGGKPVSLSAKRLPSATGESVEPAS